VMRLLAYAAYLTYRWYLRPLYNRTIGYPIRWLQEADQEDPRIEAAESVILWCAAALAVFAVGALTWLVFPVSGRTVLVGCMMSGFLILAAVYASACMRAKELKEEEETREKFRRVMEHGSTEEWLRQERRERDRRHD
jgi:uncharacterized membrane protein